MARLVWDMPSSRYGEAGVSNCVLFRKTGDGDGDYEHGIAWNGIVSVSERPGGAEETAYYSDKEKYASLRGYDTFEGTIEAYTYPDEFVECDGYGEILSGAYVGQQERRPFAICYRTNIYDADGDNSDYKIHIIYGATASTSDSQYQTINESPDIATFSWDIATTPVGVKTNDSYYEKVGKSFRPTSIMILDSREIDEVTMKRIEDILYGTNDNDSNLIMPGEIIEMLYN